MFCCDQNGKRSLADFENVEEALQARGGIGFNGSKFNIRNMWWRFGIPAPQVLQNFQNIVEIPKIQGLR